MKTDNSTYANIVSLCSIIHSQEQELETLRQDVLEYQADEQGYAADEKRLLEENTRYRIECDLLRATIRQKEAQLSRLHDLDSRIAPLEKEMEANQGLYKEAGKIIDENVAEMNDLRRQLAEAKDDLEIATKTKTALLRECERLEEALRGISLQDQKRPEVSARQRAYDYLMKEHNDGWQLPQSVMLNEIRAILGCGFAEAEQFIECCLFLNGEMKP
jgi:chromosome segregation ATPase